MERKPARAAQLVGRGSTRGRPGEYLTDRLRDEALKFIEQNRDRPFFLYLSHYTVHIPLEAKQELVAKYRAKMRWTTRRTTPTTPR